MMQGSKGAGGQGGKGAAEQGEPDSPHAARYPPFTLHDSSFTIHNSQFAALWQRFEQADGGRHWRHTQQVMQNVATSAYLPVDVSRRLNPTVLHAAALLHDIGKVDGPAGHEERSYRLLLEALPPDWPPAELVLLLVRHHAALGLVQTGDASELALRPLLADVRRANLPPDLFLAHLLALTLADWLAYNLLSPRAEAGLTALTKLLSEPGWWRSPPANTEARLWRQAIGQTAERLHNRLDFAFLEAQPAPGPAFAARARIAVEQRGLPWPEFCACFARLHFDGGYSVFWRCRQLLADEAARLDFVLPHLLAWLPGGEPACGNPLVTLNMRPLAPHLPAMNLPELDAALGQIKLNGNSSAD